MFAMIWKMLPDNYKFSVAFKKVAWTIAKTGVSLAAGTKIGKEIAPENWLVVTEVSAVVLAGGMKLLHDWAKLKWPNNKLL
jgi:hypothetical protein